MWKLFYEVISVILEKGMEKGDHPDATLGVSYGGVWSLGFLTHPDRFASGPVGRRSRSIWAVQDVHGLTDLLRVALVSTGLRPRRQCRVVWQSFWAERSRTE